MLLITVLYRLHAPQIIWLVFIWMYYSKPSVFYVPVVVVQYHVLAYIPMCLRIAVVCRPIIL